MGASVTDDILASGEMLGCYRVERVLGRGGFGITYLARDTNLDILVAVKEYLPISIASRDKTNSVQPSTQEDTARFQWGLERFISEAQTLAKFKHTNIIRVMAVFEYHKTAYMVMEFERGRELSKIIHSPVYNAEASLKKLIAPIIDGLSLVHSLDFIHRDIKPANIYIREDQTPVLLDFGSARQAMGDADQTLTAMVTLGYAPLEQHGDSRTQQQGPWTDIYALGAVLYYAITGSAPTDSTLRSASVFNGLPDPLIPAVINAENSYSYNFLSAIDWALGLRISDRPKSLAEWSEKLLSDSSDTVVIKPTRIKKKKIAETVDGSNYVNTPVSNRISRPISVIAERLKPDSMYGLTEKSLKDTPWLDDRHEPLDERLTAKLGLNDEFWLPEKTLQNPVHLQEQDENTNNSKLRANIKISVLVASSLIVTSAFVLAVKLFYPYASSQDPMGPTSSATSIEEAQGNLQTTADQVAEAQRIAEATRITKNQAVAEAARIAEEKRIAEAARITEEQRVAEAARIAEEQRIAKAARIAEEQRAAEVARIAEEQQLAKAASIAEEQRVAEAARFTEEQRIAKAARIAEEQRAAEVARIAEAERIAKAARIAEEQRIAEAARIAEEQQLAKAASIAEEQRIAKAAKIAEKQQLAEVAQNKQLSKRAEAEISGEDINSVLERFFNLNAAVQKVDLVAVENMVVFSNQTRGIISQLFDRYESIKSSISEIKASKRNQSISARLRIIEMIRSNGEVVLPSGSWRDITITSNRKNGRWSKIEW